MRHPRLLILTLVLSGVLLFALAGVTLAQGGDPLPDYQGRAECSSCHRGLSRDHATGLHANALTPTTAEGAGIVADFGAGAEARTLQLPGEEAARPFTLADTVYAMGAGRYAQRFVVRDADGTLLVLPVEWNAVDGQWQPFTLAESWPDPAYDFVQNCAYCHTTGLDRESGAWVDDGVQCEACHGPGATHITLADEAGVRPLSAELTAIRGSIYNQPDAQVCGQCHSLGTAPDGRPYPLGYVPGGALLDEAVFTLSTLETDATHWWASGHAGGVAMQFNEWSASLHAVEPAALTGEEHAGEECLRCHSGDYRYNAEMRGLFETGILRGTPPDPVTLETASQGITCQVCHNPHGAADRAFLMRDEPYALCVECHSNEGIEGYVHHPAYEMFEGISLTAEIVGVPSPHHTAEDGPDCVSCHMPRLPGSEGERTSHSLMTVMPGDPAPLEAAAGCTSCHTEVTVDQMAEFIEVTQGDKAGRVAAARAAMTEDTPAWVEVALALVEGDDSRGLHNYGYAYALLNAADAELGLVPQRVVMPVEAAGSPWVSLPLLGRVPGLTMPGLVAIIAATAVLLLASLVLLVRFARYRLVGFFLLVAAVAVATAPWWALDLPSSHPEITGDDSYCMSCHSWERTSALADGRTLNLGVDVSTIAASVHGDQTHPGSMGCTDCHGTDSFPHRQIPLTLREYRQAGVNMCAMCHEDVMAHHEAVVARNIAVGCVDCHGGHNIQTVGTLLELAPVRSTPLAP